MKNKDVYELCPYCGKEEKLLKKYKIQACPLCGQPIKPCSLCDPLKFDCENCSLVVM